VIDLWEQDLEKYVDTELDQVIAEVDPQLWAHHFLLEQPDESETLHSRVLEDVWHVMDQLFRCLKRSHSIKHLQLLLVVHSLYMIEMTMQLSLLHCSGSSQHLILLYARTQMQFIVECADIYPPS
jgi:hypothetical protein